MSNENEKKNKIDAAIDVVLESERLKQSAQSVKSGAVALIKVAVLIGVVGFVVLILGVMAGVIK